MTAILTTTTVPSILRLPHPAAHTTRLIPKPPAGLRAEALTPTSPTRPPTSTSPTCHKTIPATHHRPQGHRWGLPALATRRLRQAPPGHLRRDLRAAISRQTM